VNEQQIQNQIRAALGELPDLMLQRNSVGNVETIDGRRMGFGLGKGSADLVGCLAPSGRFFALEVKTATGRVRPEQRVWLEVVRRFGGFATVVRSVDDALAAVARARAGEFE
jgi:hypothetical protein